MRERERDSVCVCFWRHMLFFRNALSLSLSVQSNKKALTKQCSPIPPFSSHCLTFWSYGVFLVSWKPVKAFSLPPTIFGLLGPPHVVQIVWVDFSKETTSPGSILWTYYCSKFGPWNNIKSLIDWIWKEFIVHYMGTEVPLKSRHYLN